MTIRKTDQTTGLVGKCLPRTTRSGDLKGAGTRVGGRCLGGLHGSRGRRLAGCKRGEGEENGLVQDPTRYLTQRMSWCRASHSNGGRLTGGAATWHAIPIFLGILQTFSGRHPLPTFALDRLEQKRTQVRHRWFDYVMLNREEVGSRGNAHQLLHDLLRLIHIRGENIDGILRVQVEIDPMISQSLHVGVAPRRIVALRIRRPHVGRILADHVGDGSFVLDHLLLPHVGRNSRQAVVGPGMGGDLVTFTDHALEQVRPGGRGIDSAFPQVVSRDKEGGREAILFEEIQESRRVQIGAVIICQGHDVGLGAAVDVLIVADLPQARPRIRDGGPPLRRCIRVATTELKLAVWIPAVVLFRATVPLR